MPQQAPLCLPESIGCGPGSGESTQRADCGRGRMVSVGVVRSMSSLFALPRWFRVSWLPRCEVPPPQAQVGSGPRPDHSDSHAERRAREHGHGTTKPAMTDHTVYVLVPTAAMTSPSMTMAASWWIVRAVLEVTTVVFLISVRTSYPRADMRGMLREAVRDRQRA